MCVPCFHHTWSNESLGDILQFSVLLLGMYVDTWITSTDRDSPLVLCCYKIVQYPSFYTHTHNTHTTHTIDWCLYCIIIVIVSNAASCDGTE